MLLDNNININIIYTLIFKVQIYSMVLAVFLHPLAVFLHPLAVFLHSNSLTLVLSND